MTRTFSPICSGTYRSDSCHCGCELHLCAVHDLDNDQVRIRPPTNPSHASSSPSPDQNPNSPLPNSPKQDSSNEASAVSSAAYLSKADRDRFYYMRDKLFDGIPPGVEFDLAALGTEGALIWEKGRATAAKLAVQRYPRERREGGGTNESGAGSGRGRDTDIQGREFHPACRGNGPSGHRGIFRHRDGHGFGNGVSSPPRRGLRPDVVGTPGSTPSTPGTSGSSVVDTPDQSDQDQDQKPPRPQFDEEEIDLISVEYCRLFPPGVLRGSSLVPGPNPTDTVVYKRLIYKLQRRIIRENVQRTVGPFREENAEIGVDRAIRSRDARAAVHRYREGQRNDATGLLIAFAENYEGRRARVRNRRERAREANSPPRGRDHGGRSLHRDSKEKGKSVRFSSNSFAGSGSHDQGGRIIHRRYTDAGIEMAVRGPSRPSETEQGTPAGSSGVRTRTGSFERGREANGEDGSSGWHMHAVTHGRPRPLPGWDECGGGGPSNWHASGATHRPPVSLPEWDGSETGTSSGRREDSGRMRGSDRAVEEGHPRSTTRRHNL
ncbi:hypothetical protein MMC30_003891 [Trapelia coarctata]|nr:hypothetical protein [Trapelia coarctata]